MKTTRGGRLLAEWIVSDRRTQQWLADKMDTHQTNVSAWIRGVPGRPVPLDKAIMIRDITGIAVEAWTVEEDAAAESGPVKVAKTGTEN